MNFAARLIAWQHIHGRHDLPWQGQTVYHVWLSEIMLQQTQVASVIPYYRRFIATFPDIATLAAATEEQVLAHWSGLGYYARGRNLHKAARLIVERFNGEFPRSFEDIAELPGIGRSTAAAICALAYHERRAILDGNVRRVLARHCGIEGWPGDKRVEERLWQQAEALLPASPRRGREALIKSKAVVRYISRSPRVPRVARCIEGCERETLTTNGLDQSILGIDSDIATYTQALMDLGATVCTRSRPKCDACPVREDCVALQSGRIAELPAPRPKKAVPERHAVFLLLMHGGDILLERRPGHGIWGGLWCPPQFDDETAAREWFERSGMEAAKGERMASFSHAFTHFKLHVTPLKICLARRPPKPLQPGSLWLDTGEALRAAIPAPVRQLMNQLEHSERQP